MSLLVHVIDGGVGTMSYLGLRVLVRRKLHRLRSLSQPREKMDPGSYTWYPVVVSQREDNPTVLVAIEKYYWQGRKTQRPTRITIGRVRITDADFDTKIAKLKVEAQEKAATMTVAQEDNHYELR